MATKLEFLLGSELFGLILNSAWYLALNSHAEKRATRVPVSDFSALSFIDDI